MRAAGLIRAAWQRLRVRLPLPCALCGDTKVTRQQEVLAVTYALARLNPDDQKMPDELAQRLKASVDVAASVNAPVPSDRPQGPQGPQGRLG